MTPPCEREWTDVEREQFQSMRLCTYPACNNPHATQCECCGKEYFCDDHGTHGYDDQVPEVGAVAVPAHCWKCGGFNVDG